MLKASFRINPNPEKEVIQALSESTSLSSPEIREWFRNYRRRAKPKDDSTQEIVIHDLQKHDEIQNNENQVIEIQIQNNIDDSGDEEGKKDKGLFFFFFFYFFFYFFSFFFSNCLE